MVDFCLEHFREVKENRDCLWRSWHPGERCLKTTGSCVWRTVLFEHSQHPSEAKLEPRERDEVLRKNDGLGASWLGDSEPMGPLHNLPPAQAVSGIEKQGKLQGWNSATCSGGKAGSYSFLSYCTCPWVTGQDKREKGNPKKESRVLLIW